MPEPRSCVRRHLGQDDGLSLDEVDAFWALTPEEAAKHAAMLVDADWFTNATTRDGRLGGRHAERVLPLGWLL